MKSGQLIAICAMIAFASVTGSAFAQNVAPPLDDYLRNTVKLNSDQIADAQKGRIVVKLLPTDLNRDVTVFGIVGIHVSRDAYVTRLRDVKALISSRTQRSGIIGDPVTPVDLQNLAVDPSEWHDLKSCRVGDCDFKLPASSMSLFAEAVDWNAPNAEQQVDSIMRSQMAELITAYRAHGNSAMPRYDDTNGVQGSDAFAALLAQSPFLPEYSPVFRAFLGNFPADRPEGALDVMYWSMDKINHLRPTLTVNQMIVYAPATGVPFVARKQIYADHYFEASLAVSAVFEAPNLAGGKGIYLVSVRRYRFDSLPGGFLNIRGRARNALQKLMDSDLERERKLAEAQAMG